MNKKLLAIPAFLLVATLGVSATASAESVSGQLNAQVNVGAKNSAGLQVRGDTSVVHPTPNRPMNAVFGTVTAVNGTTITVSSKSMDKNATAQVTTTYTINASGATVDKSNAASSVSAIAVGDTIMAEGKIDGVNVTATKIHDGVMAKGGAGISANSIPEGNGQPIVGGTVTAVNGNTVTISNKSNVSYTIDVTSAKITKAGTTATVSNIAVGDSMVAQGTINGTSVTAVNVVDAGAATSTTANTQAKVGIFAQIGNFFARIFGFGK